MDTLYFKSDRYGYCEVHRRIATHVLARPGMKPEPTCNPQLGGIMIPCQVTFTIPDTDQPIPQPNMTNQPNHHEVNPHYRPEANAQTDRACDSFEQGILASYAALNARKAEQYESELVPLSNKPGAPLIPQYKLPLA